MDDLDTNSTSKFLLYRFMILRNDQGLDSYRIRHTQILEDNVAIESLQTKNWQYFTEKVIDFSKGSNVVDFEWLGNKRSILDDSLENIIICKRHYLYVYWGIATIFYDYLKKLPTE